MATMDDYEKWEKAVENFIETEDDAELFGDPFEEDGATLTIFRERGFVSSPVTPKELRYVADEAEKIMNKLDADESSVMWMPGGYSYEIIITWNQWDLEE